MLGQTIIFAALFVATWAQGQGQQPNFITPPPSGPAICENRVLLGCSQANANHGCCSECIAKVMEDFAIIQMEKLDVNGDLITYGHPSLHNCQFCAGQ